MLNASGTSTFILVGPGPSSNEVLYFAFIGFRFWADQLEPVDSVASLSLDADKEFNPSLPDTTISFPIKGAFFNEYIAGFPSGSFSYFCTRQKPMQGEMFAKLVRVCNKDPDYHSYTEVQLECRNGDSKYIYNRLQAVYVAKAGSDLASQMCISPGEDILIAAFSPMGNRSDEPDKRSAICIYSLRLIEETMESIQSARLIAQISRPESCVNLSKEEYNLASGHSKNHPLDGTKLVVVKPAITYDSELLTSLVATTSESHTVVFAGTSDGHLKKVLRVPFHECSIYSNCFSCLTAKDPFCGWCPVQGICGTSSDSCARINGIMHGDLEPYLFDLEYGLCPFVHSSRPEIYVPLDDEPHVSVQVYNLYSFMTNLTCVFSNGSNVHRSKGYLVNNTLRCSLQDIDFLRAYEEAASIATLNLSVEWAQGRSLDTAVQWTPGGTLNSSVGIPVLVYKCFNLAKNCGQCLQLPAEYNCGWCSRGSVGICTLKKQCFGIGTESWLNGSEICPHPKIVSFHPVSGPMEGGTRITINGINLGNSFSNIKDAVRVSDVECRPVEELFIPGQSITCDTGRAAELNGSIVVKIQDDKDFMTTSSDTFLYVNPNITDFSPHSGPWLGGTVVAIEGHFLDVGSNANVTVADVPCAVMPNRTSSVIQCRTGASNSVRTGVIVLHIENAKRNFPKKQFSYVQPPEVTSVDPVPSITNGGRGQTDSVKNHYPIIADIAGLVVIVIVAMVLGTRLRMKQQEAQLKELQRKLLDSCKTSTEVNKHMPIHEQLDALPYDMKFDIPHSRINLGEMIGQGNFGLAHKGYLLTNSRSRDSLLVVVKMPKGGTNEVENFEVLIQELKMMIYAGDHINVLKLHGAVTELIQHRKLYVLTEYCGKGSLLEVLISKQHQDNNLEVSAGGYSSPKSPTFDEEDSLLFELLSYSYQVANGMEYLAARNFIHRDLAARNILLNGDDIIKICDFGLSRGGEYYKDERHRTPLPIKWTPIEALEKGLFTVKSDVWSYGILNWEIFSLGKIPYAELDIRDVLPNVREGYRLEKPELASDAVYEMMKACWINEPDMRPTFTQCKSNLAIQLELISKKHFKALIIKLAIETKLAVATERRDLENDSAKAYLPIKNRNTRSGVFGVGNLGMEMPLLMTNPTYKSEEIGSSVV